MSWEEGRSEGGRGAIFLGFVKIGLANIGAIYFEM